MAEACVTHHHQLQGLGAFFFLGVVLQRAARVRPDSSGPSGERFLSALSPIL